MHAEIPTLVTLDEAQAIVRIQLFPLWPESVALSLAVGRTLATDVRCDIDVPPFDRAMMDGYAVRSADTSAVPARLRVAGQIAAGSAESFEVSAGEALQINTGAPMPAGADCVVPVEETSLVGDSNEVAIHQPVKSGQHVCPRGRYVRAGEVVLEAGDLFGPGEIAIAATAGAAIVEVHVAPTAALLVTGDELVGVDKKPAAGQIRDSNGPLLAALLARDGATVTDLGRVGDRRDALVDMVRRGLEHNVLCITGGVSMGEFDFVPESLAACGVRILFQKMRTRPGRPTLFGVTDTGTLVFGLPGNPISALVGYLTLVRPALGGLQGRDRWPRLASAVLQGALKAAGDRQSFWPAAVALGASSRLFARPLTWYGSGDPFGLRGANGFVVQAAHTPAAADGDTVHVMLLDWQDAD